MLGVVLEELAVELLGRVELFEPLGGQPLGLGDFDDNLRVLIGQELLGLRVDVRIGLQAFQIPLGGIEQLALAKLFQKLLHRLLGHGWG